MKNWTKSSLASIATLVLISLLLLAQSVSARMPLAQDPQTPTPIADAVPDSPQALLSPSSLLFTYQGQLLDASGNPMNGRVDVTFRLYHLGTGGTAFWTEAYTGTQAITVTNGLFRVLLGSRTPINQADLTGDIYLELKVGAETLTPRELFTSAAYAVEASTLPAGATTRGALTVPGDLVATGNVGIGTTSPAALLHLSSTSNPLLRIDPGASTSVSPTIWLRDTSDGAGFKIVYSNSTGATYFDNYYNNAAGDIFFRTKVAGTPVDVMTLEAAGNVGIGTTSPGANSRLNVVGGAIAVGATPQTADAAIHVTSSFGGADRLLQMSPTGNSKPGLNLLASTNASGGSQWWTWGVTTDNKFRIQSGTAFAGSGGLSVDTGGSTTVGGSLFLGGPDFTMNELAGRGGGRAMVNDGGDTLTINYANDFAGGVRLNGSVTCGALVEANLQTQEELDAGKIDRFTEGDALCWGIDQLELCSTANDRLVQAVADKSGKPIIIGAEKVKVLGPVQRGDILVASSVPGYAMVNNDPKSGSVIAQALEDFDGGRGLVKAMIRKW